MLITKEKFKAYQKKFASYIKATPYHVTMEIISVVHNSDSGEFNLAEFVGDSPRTSTEYQFNALFEKDISDRMREKYGLPQSTNGVIYLSPLQLIPIFGDYHLNLNTTKFKFEGRTQVINKIIYLEEMFQSCLGLQIFITDDIKGG